MLNDPFVFESHGSSLMLQKIIWVDLKFAKFSPMIGSSFFELIVYQRYLLNIRNLVDFECFSNCYIAWYHDMHEPNIADPFRDSATNLTKTATFRLPNHVVNFPCPWALTTFISSKP